MPHMCLLQFTLRSQWSKQLSSQWFCLGHAHYDTSPKNLSTSKFKKTYDYIQALINTKISILILGQEQSQQYKYNY